MKTYKQFIDEALASSLIKAAARSVLRNQALQNQISKTSPSLIKRTILKPRQITGFQTSRGSKYTYQRQPGSWPQTQRTAPKDPYHPTSPGIKQKSDWTVFTTPDASMTMRQRFRSNSKEPFYKGLPQSTTPKIGRAPVEVWNKYAEKGGRQAIHPGSQITDIQTRSAKSGIGLYGSQRKELTQRVSTALKNPRNRQYLRSQIRSAKGMSGSLGNIGNPSSLSVTPSGVTRPYQPFETQGYGGLNIKLAD